MKVLVLTTKTDHHDYFIHKISKSIEKISVIYETKINKFNFKTNHILLKKRERFEKKYFNLKSYKKKFSNLFIQNINSKKTIDKIREYKPDIIIVFGTSILQKRIINFCKKTQLVNLHGGDPQKYRGLDSHLWCLYHKDFKSLVTTLHYVDAGIDTGDIIETLKIKKQPKKDFNELRIRNVENCINLFLNYYKKLIQKGKIIRKKQLKKGRYYSAFPSIFIEKAVKNFKNEKLIRT